MTTDTVRPGDLVRIRPGVPGPHAGRMGQVVQIEGEVCRVRFSTMRSYPFAISDLRRVHQGVR